MSFEKPLSAFIKTTINRPEHCRLPECKMSVMADANEKCTPVTDVVNRNVYNRVCAPGLQCNTDGNCIKSTEINNSNMRFCENDNDNNCIKELRNCKQVKVNNPIYGEYENMRKICYGIIRTAPVLDK